MAGVAVERLRRAGSLSAADEAGYLRTVREALEEAPTRPSPTSGGGNS
jgi:hypothetical protein